MRNTFFATLFMLIACTGANRETATADAGEFKGEYLVGDGGWIIEKAGDHWQMMNAPGVEPTPLYFEGMEADTLYVYATRDRSVIFKMNPGHRAGMYYEPDEQWPVSLIESAQEPDPEKVLAERQTETEKEFGELIRMDGVYAIQTESEGVSASLKLTYQGERVFAFELLLEVADVCSGSINDTFTMDRTQHGFYDKEGCMLHFNFTDSNDEVEIDQPEGCSLMKGECIFTSRWVRSG